MSLRLDEIELEVIYIILEYVNDTSPATLKSIQLANKFFNAAAQSILGRRRTLTLSNSIDQSLKRNNWIHDSNVLRNLRHLTVESRRLGWGEYWDASDLPPYAEIVEIFEPFNEVIRLISNLKTLTWNAGPLPHTLLVTLKQKHPMARLRLFKFTRFNGFLDHLDESETALANFTNLTHFRFDVRALPGIRLQGGYPPGDYNLTPFREIIAKSRNLRYAGLVCPRLNPTAFGSSRGSNADVSNHKQSRCKSIRSLTIDNPGLTMSKSSLEELNEFLDISRLNTLKFSRGIPSIDYFQNAAIMLPNLKDVSLNFSGFNGTAYGSNPLPVLVAAKDYLTNCSPLRALSLWAWAKVVNVPDLVARHGSTLEVLQLHEKDDESNRWTTTDAGSSVRTKLPLEDLKMIRASCPKLADLTFDINRENASFQIKALTATQSVLDELVHFQPPLRKLQLYYDACGLAEHLFGPDVFLPSSDDSDSDYEALEDEQENESENSEVNESEALLVAVPDDSGTGIPENSASVAENAVQANDDEAETIASPPRKRCRTESSSLTDATKSDPEQILQDYVKSIWKHVYGSQTTGERLLDVKFGEWESKVHLFTRDTMTDPRRFFEVRPHERDDMIGECVVVTHKPRVSIVSR